MNPALRELIRMLLEQIIDDLDAEQPTDDARPAETAEEHT